VTKVLRCSDLEPETISAWIKEVSKLEETQGICDIKFDADGMFAYWN